MLKVQVGVLIPILSRFSASASQQNRTGTSGADTLPSQEQNSGALRSQRTNEPLLRVHECVFDVLALESEQPVDPR